MTRFKHLPFQLKTSIENRSLLKIISGLSNFDPISVAMIAKSAFCGGADLLDIACDPGLVRIALKEADVPVCVSAIDPELFPPAVEAGASMIEIGNFDSFYPKGRIFDSCEILKITKQTLELMLSVPISVTVPHVLPLDEQAQLALDLVSLGADVIQTEGGTSSNPSKAGMIGLIEKAAPTLASTQTISQTLRKAGFDTPVICASGLSAVTVPLAIASGASGVGVGSAVNLLNDEIAMVAAVRSLRESIGSTIQQEVSFL